MEMMKVYPILCQIQVKDKMVQGKIVKLLPMGFLIELQDTPLKAGENTDCEFIIPHLNHAVKAKTVVMKLYDTMSRPKTKEEEKHLVSMLEMHFRDLPAEAEKKIKTFCELVGQK
jgi:hypothetical protein